MKWNDITLEILNDDDGDGDLETDDGDYLNNGDDKWNEVATYMV